MSDLTFPITIEIEQNWLKIAQKFAAEQSFSVHQKQVFLNTLVVYGLHQYLVWGGVASRLEESYSWHPQTRVLTGWSDLYLPEYGRVMAFPQQDQITLTLPEILPMGCVGGMLFEVNRELTALTLKGFITEQRLYAENKVLAIAQLDPADQLFDALFLRAEERLIVTEEIESYLQNNDDLQPYFQEFLTEDGIINLINRLNYLYYQNDAQTDLDSYEVFESENIEESAMLIVRESTTEYLFAQELGDDPYGQAIAHLTQSLLEKISELRDSL